VTESDVRFVLKEMQSTVQLTLDNLLTQVLNLKKIPSNERDLYYNTAIMDVVNVIQSAKNRVNNYTVKI
jgi:flagellin-like hook-associated protein FlgL